MVTAGLFLAGCGQQERGQETTEETTPEETTAGETILVEGTVQQETTTPASGGEQVAKAEVETTRPAQAVDHHPPSNEESQPPTGFAPSQEPGADEAGQGVSSTPEIFPPTESLVFFPVQNGVTYSCTGGPPFVHHGHDASMGNCAVRHVGPPAGFVCDIPTTITIVHDIELLVLDGSVCRSSADASFTSPEAALPAQAQPYSFGPESAPYGVGHEH